MVISATNTFDYQGKKPWSVRCRCRLLIKVIKLAPGEIQFLKPNKSAERIGKCVCVYREWVADLR